jgi:purine-binding chemotaxis protein CheW
MEPAATSRFITFRVGLRLYAVPAGEVAEVIRVPPAARVPHSPRSLLGLANLRGSVVPVASLRRLLGLDDMQASPDARAIVLDGPAPIAVAVDKVDALIALDDAQVETRQVQMAEEEEGEALRGAFQIGGGLGVAKILDLKRLLEAQFIPRARSARTPQAPLVASTELTAEAAREIMVVSFQVAGQEYGFTVQAVQEILAPPSNLALAPRADAMVLGVGAFRNTLLPLLSLRALLGFPQAPPTGLEKVIVVPVSDVLVGLVVDRARSIVRLDPEAVDPAPKVLAARAGGETQIKAIARLDGGRRLISILDTRTLFREDIMQRLVGAADQKTRSGSRRVASHSDETQYLVFRLGEEEFALPVSAVDEVAGVPATITRVPKTPKFMEGVINLRGEVLPVVDQRRRFNMPVFSGEGRRRRLVVVRSERHRAGLIVDSVSEVLRAQSDAIEPAPDLTGEDTRLVQGVINFGDRARLILVLDPAELLSRSERNFLDKFDPGRAAPPP